MADLSDTMKYAVVIERGPKSYGAHVPDLPGCVAIAETKTEACVDSRGHRALHWGA